MYVFQYKAYNDKFQVIKGKIEENELDIAKEKLEMQGLTIIDIKKKFKLKNLSIFKRKLKYEEIASFCGQMAVVLESGLNIINGVEIIKNQNKRLKRELDEIIRMLKNGQTLGTAMESSGYFPKLLTDIVKSGELSGNIDEVLVNMEEYFTREASFRTKVKNASIYPLIILIAGIGIMIFFNFFIFSKLTSIYSDNNNLPLITKVLLVVMNFMNKNIIVVIVFFILIFPVLKYSQKIEKVKNLNDRIIFKLPVLGKLNSYMITDRFARSLSIFIRSAVPILVAMESFENIIGNSSVSKKINDVRQKIVTGVRISEALEEMNFFEPLVIQMIRVGEETGKLEEMLNKLSNIYDKKVESELNKAMTLIEPIFTLIIGLVVGFVVVGIALPILQMSNNIK